MTKKGNENYNGEKMKNFLKEEEEEKEVMEGKGNLRESRGGDKEREEDEIKKRCNKQQWMERNGTKKGRKINRSCRMKGRGRRKEQ